MTVTFNGFGAECSTSVITRPECREFSVVLPHPIGLNASYAVGNGRFYKRDRAAKWQEDAALLMQAGGWRKLPEGEWELAVWYNLATIRQDIDACVKALLDSIVKVLGVNDSCVMVLTAIKTRVHHQNDQGLSVLVTATRTKE